MADQQGSVVYLSSNTARLGVDLSRGAGICHFSLNSNPGFNLLNAYDHGRLVQQSCYGNEDGSDWNGRPWRYNPVQGGSWQGQSALLRAFRTEGPTRLHAEVNPRHWATGALLPEVDMSVHIELQGDVAAVGFHMAYNGSTAHVALHQESPALFCDRRLHTLALYGGPQPWSNAPVTRLHPGPTNEYHATTETWAAFVDEHDCGVGLAFKEPCQVTTYRVGSNQDMGNPANCCYFAPIVTEALQPGSCRAFTVYLTAGRLEDMRASFYGLRQQGSI